MPDFSNFYPDGNIKWFNKPTTTTDTIITPPTSNQRIISGLVAANVLTDLKSISIKIIYQGQQIIQFAISEVASTDIVGTRLFVYSGDELPVVLEFINESEAINGDIRFTQCLNGVQVV